MKINISTAVKQKKNRFPLDTFHLTTLGFGRTIVSNIFELDQGEKVSGSVKQFFRMSPLVVPTYGNAYVITRAFCVPFRIVTRNWESFFSQSTETGVNVQQPSISNKKLVEYFTDSGGYGLSESTASVANYDFNIALGDQSIVYYYFTEKGRWLYQILQGLGYQVNWDLRDETLFELRPILAFMRCCYDYLYPSRYVNGIGLGEIFDLTSYDQGDIDMIFQRLCDCLFVPYLQDYYNSAWLSFNSPTGSSSNSSFDVSSSDQSGLKVYNSQNRTSVIQNSNTSTETLSSYSLRLLQAVSDIVTRNNVAGRRFIERIKGTFGYATQEQQHSYAEFIKSFSHSINLMDVTATTGTDSQLLGEQAGKGYVTGSDKFSFEAKEHCYIVFITQIMPSVGYFQGRKPWTIFKDSPLKYYRPELDSVGMQPLRNDELFADFMPSNGSSSVPPYERYDNMIQNGGRPSGIFGFVPRYLEYKKGYDFITGDFRLRSRSIGGPSYHTMRVLHQPSTLHPLANDAAFLRVDDQYNRIFAVDPSNVAGAKYDHFIGYFSFNFTKYSHKLSISESLPLFNKSGRDVNLNYEGMQL